MQIEHYTGLTLNENIFAVSSDQAEIIHDDSVPKIRYNNNNNNNNNNIKVIIFRSQILSFNHRFYDEFQSS